MLSIKKYFYYFSYANTKIFYKNYHNTDGEYNLSYSKSNLDYTNCSIHNLSIKTILEMIIYENLPLKSDYNRYYKHENKKTENIF